MHVPIYDTHRIKGHAKLCRKKVNARKVEDIQFSTTFLSLSPQKIASRRFLVLGFGVAHVLLVCPITGVHS